MTDDLINVSVGEGHRLTRGLMRRDPEVIEYCKLLWPTSGACFVCGTVLGPGEGATMILPDCPNTKRGLTMLARQCADCAGLPYMTRYGRLVRILKGMWPRWHPSRPGPGQLPAIF